MSGKRLPEEAALDRLVRELRAEPTPELDWDRVEARLLSEPRPEPLSVTQRFSSRLRVPAMGLLAASVVALVVLHRAPTATQLRPVAQMASGPLNGDKLALGTRVTAGNHNVVVEHAGRARWTLEPHATAFVSDAGEFLTLQLESGALSAAVVPNTKPETFAVEAGNTRVAVHGTAFRVERAGDRVLVAVSEGTVAVEPTQTHSDPSFLLRRDSRGNFGLDGRTGTVEGNASVVVHDTQGQSHREIAQLADAPRATPHPAAKHGVALPAAVHDQAAPATPGSRTLPLQPSISDIENGVSSAVGLLNGCFRSKSPAASNSVSVSASTGMTLSVAPDGSVQSVTFSPPLAPTVEDCAVLGLRQLTFASSVEGVSFTRIIELTR